MNYTINLTEKEYYTLISALNIAICNSRRKADENSDMEYLKKGYENEVKGFEDTLSLVTRNAKNSDERKYVLIRQDSLNDVQDIFILDTLEEAEAKMDEEYKSTLAWLIKHGIGEEDFIKECGERYRNLIAKHQSEDHTYLWSIHLSD